MNVSLVRMATVLLFTLTLSACDSSSQAPRGEAPEVTLVTIQPQAITLTQRYVCRLRSHHHIEIRAPEAGVLETAAVQSGDTVKEDAVLFTLQPALKRGRPDAEQPKPIPIKAPFDGLVNRILRHAGELVPMGEPLTTLSDSSLMWAYFDVPEASYLEYQAARIDQRKEEFQVELVLANGDKFNQPGVLATVGGAFDPATGSIAFRADFPNPKGLLRHGQSGTVLLSRGVKDVLVVPQRATFEVDDKRYVYVVDSGGVAHRQAIAVQSEVGDQFVVRSGVQANDRIIVEGIRLVQDGGMVQFDDPAPKKLASDPK